MTVHEAVCEDCSWSVRDEDFIEVSDAAERHATKEFHQVDVQRAVATDGGELVEPNYGLGATPISADMCAAIRALRRDDWTVSEVAFALELNHRTVIKHGNGECQHDTAVSALDEDERRVMTDGGVDQRTGGTERSDMERCINCGDEIEDEPVYDNGGLKDDAGDKLAGGDSVSISEVFAFDDGPYCSLDCSVATATEQGGRR